MIRRALALVLLNLLAFPVAWAEDWPEFRGPTGQGVSDAVNLPVDWSTTRNVAWKRPLPGKGWSSPIVYAGRIYVTAAVPPDAAAAQANAESADQSLRTLCLDAVGGQELWNVEVFRQRGADTEAIHGKNSHASPTPLTDGRLLYVHFGTHGTAALDLDGNIRWQNRELKYKPQHGNGGSPALVDKHLVLSVDGSDVDYVVALDRETGRIAWKTPRELDKDKQRFSFSTPLAIEVAGRTQVVSSGTDSVSAYDPLTGRELWKVGYTGFSVVPRPVFGQGLLFICTGFGTPHLLAIRPDGAGDVTSTHVAWREKRQMPNTPSPLLVGEDLYVVSDSGIATCLDAKTGQQHWQKRLGGNYSAAPLFADGKVYFQSEDGTGIVLSAGRQYTELSRNSLGERTLASYAVADGAIFIRGEQNLYRIQNP